MTWSSHSRCAGATYPNYPLWPDVLKPVEFWGRFWCIYPKKQLLDPPFSFWKKKATLRSCRHGRWYPSPRPGEWHQPEQSWYRVVDDIKSPQNFQGIFLIRLLMDAWWLKRLKAKSMVKKTLYKKKKKHELSSNVNPKQASLSRAVGANSRMWESISKMWNQTPFCDMVIQALRTESWNPYNEVSNHLVDSLYPCAARTKTYNQGAKGFDHCVPWVALFETSCCNKIAGNCSWR